MMPQTYATGPHEGFESSYIFKNFQVPVNSGNQQFQGFGGTKALALQPLHRSQWVLSTCIVTKG